MHWKLLIRAALLLVLVVLSRGCATNTESQIRANAPTRMLSVQEVQAFSSAPPDRRLAYGERASQFGELRVPAGRGPHPVAVLIHGGCRKEPYGALRDLGPLGDALKAEGIATWNIEYRRLYEPGSGWPGTYLDVGRALDHLRVIANEYRLDLDHVVVVGHSAGGYADLVELLLPHATEIRFLNPGIELCVANALSRPWEPEKYSSKEDQDARLEFLIGWIREYETRTDEYSLVRHRLLFEGFDGAKREFLQLDS